MPEKARTFNRCGFHFKSNSFTPSKVPTATAAFIGDDDDGIVLVNAAASADDDEDDGVHGKTKYLCLKATAQKRALRSKIGFSLRGKTTPSTRRESAADTRQ